MESQIRSEEMSKWQKMDTRPDEGEFLAWDPVAKKQDVCHATSELKNGVWIILSCEASQYDGEYGPYMDEFRGERATHWMPLPEPPK
jgi:hypothetical protein